MENSFLTPKVIARETLRALKNQCRMLNLVHRDYENKFHKVGDTITIRRPNVYKAIDGPDITGKIQATEEEGVDIKVDIHKTVPVEFSVTDLTLTLEELRERYFSKMVLPIVNAIDFALTGLYVDIYQMAGTPGTTPSSFNAMAAAGELLDDMAVPGQDRKMCLNPRACWRMADALKGLFLPGVVEPAVKEGFVGHVADHDLYKDQNIRRHTAGTLLGAPAMNGATAEGATSLVTNAWTGGATMKKGDIFTVALVNSINPVNKQSTGRLQQFVATADCLADGGGNMTIPIQPKILADTDNAKQNVSALPLTGGLLTTYGSHVANLAFLREAFALVTVPIELPRCLSVNQKHRETHEGLTVTVTEAFDINTYKQITRVDILAGVKTIRPEVACRLAGEAA